MMYSEAGDAAETSRETLSNDLQNRTEELKQSLIVWRKILLPLNNLLEWERTYDPVVIFAILTSIFILIRQTNPPVLTFISCLVLIMVLMELLVPTVVGMVYKNEEWTLINDEKYSRLCQRIAQVERYIKQRYQSTLKIRQERPMMYSIVGGILLVFIAICGQRIDNLLLTYLAALIVCLLPGVYNRPLIRHCISQFWNRTKTPISSSETAKPKTP